MVLSDLTDRQTLTFDLAGRPLRGLYVCRKAIARDECYFVPNFVYF